MRSAAEQWQCRIVAGCRRPCAAEYAQQISCRPGPEITYFARARIARPTPVLLHQLARYVEIRSSLPFSKSCLHSSAESAGDIGTERRLCGCRCVCSLSTPDAMSAQGLHSEASGGLDLRLVVSHRTGWTRQVLQGTDDPEWQPAFTGRPSSTFRVCFAVDSDAPIAMTLPLGPFGRRCLSPRETPAFRSLAAGQQEASDLPAYCSQSARRGRIPARDRRCRPLARQSSSRSKRPRHNIDVRSRVGASSAFTVEVPLGRAEVADVPEHGQYEEQGCTLSRGTTPVVEDDRAVRELLQLLLDDEGHRTLVAADGAQSIRAGSAGVRSEPRHRRLQPAERLQRA
jgi:hypothetical protein